MLNAMRTFLFRVSMVTGLLLGLPMLVFWVVWRWMTGRLHTPDARPVPQHELVEPVGISAQDR